MYNKVIVLVEKYLKNFIEILDIQSNIKKLCEAFKRQNIQT